MIEKTDSIKYALATIAILGQPPRGWSSLAADDRLSRPDGIFGYIDYLEIHTEHEQAIPVGANLRNRLSGQLIPGLLKVADGCHSRLDLLEQVAGGQPRRTLQTYDEYQALTAHRKNFFRVNGQTRQNFDGNIHLESLPSRSLSENRLTYCECP